MTTILLTVRITLLLEIGQITRHLTGGEYRYCFFTQEPILNTIEPTDDEHLINYEGLVQISKFTLDLTRKMIE